MEFTISSSRDIELIDITDKIASIVEKANVEQGIAFIYALHATAAITICESYDPNMLVDLENKIRELFPKNAGYLHDQIDSNAHSHLISSFFKPSQVVPVKDNKLQLGTWQAIILIEADGPKKRTIDVKVIEEK